MTGRPDVWARAGSTGRAGEGGMDEDVEVSEWSRGGRGDEPGDLLYGFSGMKCERYEKFFK